LQENDAALLIGSDCPGIDASYLHQALLLLDAGSDVVVGPADDGGYVLIGMREDRRSLFEEISWGTPAVFRQTLAKLQSAGLSFEILDSQADIDRPEDLARLPEFDIFPQISRRLISE
ncbi:MAG: DUF2064 domain-containing protein, partial [Pseudohongiellaceae bacterium]